MGYQVYWSSYCEIFKLTMNNFLIIDLRLFIAMLMTFKTQYTGMRPTARHHYRGGKMALWLDLLPKMNVANDLLPRYHLLEGFRNKSTFEHEGTMNIDPNDVLHIDLPASTTNVLYHHARVLRKVPHSAPQHL